MAHLLTPIDVPNIVKDFQRIVVDLKESEKINQSLSHAHRVADIIRRRCGDTTMRHGSGHDVEEHKRNRNRQLRDLDNENRQLRQLYEDSQWTLHLVMEAHRRLMEATFGKDNTIAECQERSEEEENVRQDFCVKTARMAYTLYGVFEQGKEMKQKLLKRMEELREENEILRSVLDECGAESQMDDGVRNKTPRSLNTSEGSAIHSDEQGCSDCDEEDSATPRKKQA